MHLKFSQVEHYNTGTWLVLRTFQRIKYKKHLDNCDIHIKYQYCKAFKPNQPHQPFYDVVKGCDDRCCPEWSLFQPSLCVCLSYVLAGVYTDFTSSAGCISLADLGLAPKAGGIVAVHPKILCIAFQKKGYTCYVWYKFKQALL